MSDRDHDDAPEFEVNELSSAQRDTLAGDVRDAMLTRFRQAQKPWSMMNEEEQSDLANGFELAAKAMIREAVQMLTASDFPHAVVKLVDVKIIGGDNSRIDVKCVAGNISHNRDVLGDYVGDMVQLVAIDSEKFMGERAPAKIDKDQPDLPIDGFPDALEKLGVVSAPDHIGQRTLIQGDAE